MWLNAGNRGQEIDLNGSINAAIRILTLNFLVNLNEEIF